MLRPLLRQVAYRSGALSLARARLRQALTVVMLHRVIDPADPDFPQADPTYTVSVPLFAELLGFFRDHYTVVGIRDVMDACDGVRALPDHSLLITFDDGWADNLRYAAPLLHERRMPAVVFAAAEAVMADSTAWWQERIFAAARAGKLDDWLAQRGNYARIMGQSHDSQAPHPLDVVTRLASIDPGERQHLLGTLAGPACHARMMLRPDELARLPSFGIDVGLHGYRHVPLTDVLDVRDELSKAREAVAALTAGAAITTVLGCPHGRYNDTVVAGAHDVGIKLVFTSDPQLNATRRGMLSERPLGRISMLAAQLEGSPDRLDAARAARWLWDRECR